MECQPSTFKENLKEESFSTKFINVLKATKYEGVNAATLPRLTAGLKVFESDEKMQPFIKWFSECITEDNCITSHELETYKNLRMNGNLVPEEELDNEISKFCGEPSPDLFLDYESYTDLANKELEALESFELFLSKVEKNSEKKKEAPAFDVEPFLRSELESFEKLDKQMNSALENYATFWEELRKNVSYNRRYPEESIKRVNELTNKIDKNVNYALENYFKKVKPTDGKIKTSVEELWAIFKKFTAVREEIINTVSKTEGLLSFKKKLMELSQQPLSCISSLDEIREKLHEEKNLEKLRRILANSLREESNSISSLELFDKENSSKFLANQLDMLSKLEDILRQKKLYTSAFSFVIKRNQIVQEFQLEKLNECLKKLLVDISAFQQRMDKMSTLMPKKDEGIDSNFKVMMKLLNTKHQDLKSLNEGIAGLHRHIKETEDVIQSNFLSLEQAVIKRLASIERRNNTLIDGATREAFSEVFKESKPHIDSAMKTQLLLENKVSKIQLKFNEMQMNKTPSDDCLWIKCLNNPAEFVNLVIEMERKLSEIKNENERLFALERSDQI